MKNSKKHFNIAGQSNNGVKKSQKHDANLQKNSSLYFQIGLILCLLATYSLFEMQFQEKKLIISKDVASLETVSIDYVKPFQPEVIKPKDVEAPKQKVQKILDKIKPIDNDVNVIEKKLITSSEIKPKFNAAAITDISEPVEEDPVNLVDFRRIEKVPVYPGCENWDTNDERKKCMSDKITKLINRKFNGDLAAEYGLSGKQRISTQFTIDKLGNVVDIKIRAPHPVLENEADRVINKIPKMQPGMQRNVPVGVIYTLPIVFLVR